MNYGFWTNEENLIYYKYLSLYQINGVNKINYKDLSNIMKTRTPVQIRTHHQKEYKKILEDTKLLLKLRQ